jgi:hypothetical protein
MIGASGVRAAVAAGLLIALVVPGAHARAEAAIDITISNNHYCRSDVCTFADQAYVRPAALGPVLADVVVNPVGVVDVRRGDTVTWTYRDTTLCDRLPQCPGHDVVFEDGSVGSPLLLPRTTEPQIFSWTVPQSASVDRLILYYCSVRPGGALPLGHSDVMTGALRIVE